MSEDESTRKDEGLGKRSTQGKEQRRLVSWISWEFIAFCPFSNSFLVKVARPKYLSHVKFI